MTSEPILGIHKGNRTTYHLNRTLNLHKFDSGRFFFLSSLKMPFIIPNQYSEFKYLIERYRQVINCNPTAHCLIGFTAAAILRNDEPVDLRSFEGWLKSIQVTSQKYTQDTVIDQILATLENYQRQIDTTPLEEENEAVEEVKEEEQDFCYELKRFTSRSPYSAY